MCMYIYICIITTICTCCSTNSATKETALGLLGALPEAQVQGNCVTFNAALSALEKGAEWQRALALLASMGKMWMERTPGDVLIYPDANQTVLEYLPTKLGHV